MTINPMDLTGKTILITGASDGIGKATAILCSQLGANIILVARNEEKLQEVYSQLEGSGHQWYSYDLMNIEGIEDFIDRIVQKEGRMDGVVHCAGIGNMRPLKLMNYEFLHEVMTINFYSFVSIVKAVTKQKNFNIGLSIVGMSSIASLMGDKTKTAYCASKSAMDGAIRAMAKELGPRNIRINSIIGGFIKTEMYYRYKERTGKDETDSEFTRFYMGLGEPIDIANAIAFLLGDCSRIITGTGLVVDSGATS